MVTYPGDWDERSIGDFVLVGRGASPRPIEAFLTSGVDGVNWIKIGDAPRYGKYITQTAEKITQSGAVRSVRVNAGDFILSNSMSFGRPYILNIDGCIHDGWLRLYDYQDSVDKEFLYYLLSSEDTKKQYATFAAGSGVQNLNKTVVKKVVVHLPPIPEQRRIARALSEMDDHIDNLAELIEKKKAIRDGALEDLMSGRTRLVEYQQDWITVPFGEYFTLLGNNTYAREQLSEHGTIGNIHYGDILVKYGNIVSERDEIPRLKEGVTFSEKWLLQETDVLIADTAEDETVGKAIQIGRISYPIVGGLHTIVCRPNMKTASGFLGYYINSKAFHDQLLPHITGIKVSSVSKKAIKTTELRIPSDLKEQEAITGVLVSMDDEISAIEDERNKMIQIREGAMDDLLTGRVRLTA